MEDSLLWERGVLPGLGGVIAVEEGAGGEVDRWPLAWKKEEPLREKSPEAALPPPSECEKLGMAPLRA
ncbi:hypothetical protein LTR16_012148, partial [Cryomyces antarcticus]